MVCYEPPVSDMGRFSVTQAATLLGLHRNSILALANDNVLRYKISARNGRKYFSGRELKRFWRTQV